MAHRDQVTPVDGRDHVRADVLDGGLDVREIGLVRVGPVVAATLHRHVEVRIALHRIQAHAVAASLLRAQPIVQRDDGKPSAEIIHALRRVALSVAAGRPSSAVDVDERWNSRAFDEVGRKDDFHLVVANRADALTQIGLAAVVHAGAAVRLARGAVQEMRRIGCARIWIELTRRALRRRVQSAVVLHGVRSAICASVGVGGVWVAVAPDQKQKASEGLAKRHDADDC